MPAPRFVAVGHVTLDHTDAVLRPGGAPLYAPPAAHRLGCAVSLLTSFGPDFPADVLPAGIEVHRVPARRTTAFRLERTPSGRELTLLHRAADLHAAHLPAAWRAANMALLCPVANEVDPLLGLPGRAAPWRRRARRPRRSCSPTSGRSFSLRSKCSGAHLLNRGVRSLEPGEPDVQRREDPASSRRFAIGGGRLQSNGRPQRAVGPDSPRE